MPLRYRWRRGAGMEDGGWSIAAGSGQSCPAAPREGDDMSNNRPGRSIVMTASLAVVMLAATLGVSVPSASAAAPQEPPAAAHSRPPQTATMHGHGKVFDVRDLP